MKCVHITCKGCLSNLLFCASNLGTFLAELCPSEDASNDVSQFTGRHEPDIQRGFTAQVLENHFALF